MTDQAAHAFGPHILTGQGAEWSAPAWTGERFSLGTYLRGGGYPYGGSSEIVNFTVAHQPPSQPPPPPSPPFPPSSPPLTARSIHLGGGHPVDAKAGV